MSEEASETVEPLHIVGSPLAYLFLDNIVVCCTLDTGAVISVVRLGLFKGPRPPPSKLRLRNVDGGIKMLYGPVLRSLKIGGHTYRFPVYEADIVDPCIIGTDFIRANGGNLDTKTQKLTLDPPAGSPLTARVSCDFQFGTSVDIGSLGVSSVFVVVRTTHAVEIQPFGSAQCTASLQIPEQQPLGEGLVRMLRADCVLECDGTLTADARHGGRPVVWPWDLGSEEGQAAWGEESSASAEKGQCATDSPQVFVHTASVSGAQAVDSPGTTPYNLIVDDRGCLRSADSLALGAEVDDALYDLPLGVVSPSEILIERQCTFERGIVPFATTKLDLQLNNSSGNHVVIPRNAIVAYVYPTSLAELAALYESVPAPVRTAREDKVPYSEQADIQVTPRELPIPDGEPLPPDLQSLVDRCDGLTSEQKEQIEDLLRRNHDIFVRHNDEFGCCSWVKFRIDTGDHLPIKQQARPVPLHLRNEVAELYRTLLEQGTVRPSQSPWASPILIVRKKTLDKFGKPEIRAVVDYRALNAVTRVPATPIPRTQELLEKLGGRKWYTHVDLASGYHNLEIAEEDIPKTAIALPDSLGLPSRFLEYTRMPFGLSAAPGVFQTVTDRLMRPSRCPTKDCDLGDANGVYLDDICVAGDEFEIMLQRTQALFNRVRASGMKLKAKKCFMFQTRLEFLGFVLNESGIAVNPAKVEKILHWPRPINKRETRSWLGLVQFYARFIPKMAEIAAPLNDLLKDRVPYIWTDICQNAFDRLKVALTTAPVLGVARADKGVFVVHCDASQRAVACILSQEQDGDLIVLHFHSRKLPTLKRPLCATHAELYALLEATKAFRLYLLGRPFIFYTDHYSLQWLRSFKHPEGKLARWLMQLEEFRFEIRHMKGKDLTNADALSRRPERPCSPDCKNCARMEEREQATEDTLTFMVRQVEIVRDQAWSDDNLAAAQAADPEIGPIYSAVQKGEKPHLQGIVGHGPTTRSLWIQFQSLCLQKGVLKRRFEHPSGDPSRVIYQTVVPANRTKDLVVQYHTGPSTGSHFGVAKCHKLLAERFYWPGIHTTVRDCVTSCLRCAKVKGPAAGRRKAPMKVFREGTLFGRFHADFLGPLQRSVPDGYRYVLIVVEAFSAWPEAIPLRTMKAPEVARALVTHVFSRLGAPYSLVTDQAKTYESEIFRAVMEIYKVHKCRVSVGKPSSNGKVENYIRSLTRQVAILAEEEPDDWPDLLPHVLHAYRAMVNNVTGFSPYEILFGRSMRVPLDLAHGIPREALPARLEINSYPAKLRARLDKIHQLVRENTSQAVTRMKSHYDKYSSLVYFKPGDVVLFYNPRRKRGKSPKLYAAWEGPFVIVSLLNDCIARIEEVPTMEPRPGRKRRKLRRLIVHVDRLASINNQMVDHKGQWLTFHSPPDPD